MQPDSQSRAHFLATAAEAMRRILIDRARREDRSPPKRLNLDNVDVAVDPDEGLLLGINEALEELAQDAPQAAKLVKLRFLIGFSYEEAAKVLGISERSAKRRWSFARAWLYRELARTAG